MFAVLLVGGILGYVFRSQAQDEVRNKLFQKLKDYNPADTTSRLTRAWDDTQTALMCCGVNEQNDWISGNNNYKSTGPRVC